MLFTLQVFKNLFTNPDREWTNVYHIEADDLASAVDAIGPVQDAEIAMHQSVVNISRVRVSTTLEGDSVFQVVPVGVAGAGSGTDFLPLFNTVRVDISTSEGGRPDRKFYRLPIDEGGQTSGQLTSAVRTGIGGLVNDMISAMATSGFALLTTTGGEWVTAVVSPAVQMRQLHRKRKKVVTP